ncbi:hypothetical protein MITS9509_00752 [Synechococcus sp. MIT S9509]|nr:hypothetical protein MITS9504_00895 [Synechococcus sp. MIT S9504]KZR92879.1 hypothetical protein MITS9509_00752 [Synechococcus sp. MIT S9509]
MINFGPDDLIGIKLVLLCIDYFDMEIVSLSFSSVRVGLSPKLLRVSLLGVLGSVEGMFLVAKLKSNS